MSANGRDAQPTNHADEQGVTRRQGHGHTNGVHSGNRGGDALLPSRHGPAAESGERSAKDIAGGAGRGGHQRSHTTSVSPFQKQRSLRRRPAPQKSRTIIIADDTESDGGSDSLTRRRRYSHMRLRAVKAQGIHARFRQGAQGGFYAYCTMLPYHSSVGRPTNPAAVDRTSVFVSKAGAEPVWRHDDSHFPIWISDRAYDRLRIEVYSTRDVFGRQHSAASSSSSSSSSSAAAGNTEDDVFMGQSTIDLAKCMRSNAGKYTVRFKLKPKSKHHPDDISGDLIVSWRHALQAERIRSDAFLTDRAILPQPAAAAIHRQQPDNVHTPAPGHPSADLSSLDSQSYAPSSSTAAAGTPSSTLGHVTPRAFGGGPASLPRAISVPEPSSKGRWSSSRRPPRPMEHSLSRSHASIHAAAGGSHSHEKLTPASTHAPAPPTHSISITSAPSPSSLKRLRLLKKAQTDPEPSASLSTCSTLSVSQSAGSVSRSGGSRASLLSSTSKRFRSLTFNPFAKMMHPKEGDTDEPSTNTKTPITQKRPPVSSEIVQIDVTPLTKKRQSARLASSSRLLRSKNHRRERSQPPRKSEGHRALLSRRRQLKRVHSDNRIDADADAEEPSASSESSRPCSSLDAGNDITAVRQRIEKLSSQSMHTFALHLRGISGSAGSGEQQNTSTSIGSSGGGSGRKEKERLPRASSSASSTLTSAFMSPFRSLRGRKSPPVPPLEGDQREYLSDSAFEQDTRPKRRSILDRFSAIRAISNNPSPAAGGASKSAKNLAPHSRRVGSSPNVVGTRTTPSPTGGSGGRHKRTQTSLPRSVSARTRGTPPKHHTMTPGGFRPPPKRAQLSFFEFLNDDSVEPEAEAAGDAKPKSMRPPARPAKAAAGSGGGSGGTRRPVERNGVSDRRAHSASARTPRANKPASDNDVSVSVSSFTSADLPSPRANRRRSSYNPDSTRKDAGPAYAESTSASDLPRPNAAAAAAARTSARNSTSSRHEHRPASDIDVKRPLPAHLVADSTPSSTSSRLSSQSGGGGGGGGGSGNPRSPPAAPTTPVNEGRTTTSMDFKSAKADKDTAPAASAAAVANGVGGSGPRNLQHRRPPPATKFANSRPGHRNVMSFMEAIELSSHSSDDYIVDDPSIRRRLPLTTEFEKDIEVAQRHLRVLFQYVRDNADGDSTKAIQSAAAVAKKESGEYPELDEPSKMAISRLRRELRQARPSERITYAMRKRARDCVESIDAADKTIATRCGGERR